MLYDLSQLSCKELQQRIHLREKALQKVENSSHPIALRQIAAVQKMKRELCTREHPEVLQTARELADAILYRHHTEKEWFELERQADDLFSGAPPELQEEIHMLFENDAGELLYILCSGLRCKKQNGCFMGER